MNHHLDTRDPKEIWWKRLDVDPRFYSPEYSVIDNFRLEYDFLSNFFLHPIIYKNKLWQTTEAAFQAMKTDNEDFQEQIRIAKHPAVAKKMGKCVPIRKDWEDVKESIMKEVCTVKFSEPKMAKALLDTGNAYLIEGTTWHDNLYGICVLKGCWRCESKIGKNILGKILMEIRKEILDGLQKEVEEARRLAK